MMKVNILSVFLLISLWNWSQDQPVSVYFSSKHPEGSKVKNTDQYFGTFQDTSKGQSRWVIDEEGIFTENVIPLNIPRKEVRESSKYTVKDGYIFGVRGNDSLPYIMNGDAYLVGIENRILQADWKNKEGSAEVLAGNGNDLYLHYKEDDYYTIVKLTIQNNGMLLSEFDYEPKIKELQELRKSEVISFQKLKTLLIAPKSKEWAEEELEKLFKVSVKIPRL